MTFSETKHASIICWNFETSSKISHMDKKGKYGEYREPVCM